MDQGLDYEENFVWSVRPLPGSPLLAAGPQPVSGPWYSYSASPGAGPLAGDPPLFLLCWHRTDVVVWCSVFQVDPSNAEDDMNPPRSSPAFISRSN